ncbi:unnamed protein product, partial [Mesorhabditis belari]|uniref:Uncharacterized protein n=1 Tax=Mesorhabditis belari TaxID=2138241 RepID=A0AAF3J778_9BILA
MADKWKTAFKTIHGKTPTKADYSLAPKHVRDELGPRKPETSKGKAVKRPRSILRTPEYTSPMKKKSKKELQTTGTPSASSLKTQKILEEVKSSEAAKVLSKGLSKKFLLTTIESPTKGMLSPLKALSHLHHKTTLTPDRPSTSTFAAPPSVNRTPIRSPRKPAFRRLVLQNTENLLLASSEKVRPIEAMGPSFDDETSELPEETINEKPKTRKNLFNTNKTRERAKSNGENFVRLNMRKKNFVRGKISAEAKRKLVRKQKWKAKFGGKRF